MSLILKVFVIAMILFVARHTRIRITDNEPDFCKYIVEEPH